MKRLVHGKLWWVSMGCMCAVVAAQVAAPAPIDPLPCMGYCPRDLVSTVWGFILTFVALTLDDWGTHKNSEQYFTGKVLWVIFSGALNPALALGIRLDAVHESLIMRRGSSTAEASAYIPTLSACDVVLNLSSHGDISRLGDFGKKNLVVDFSDALVIGKEVKGRETNNVQLSAWGKLALVGVVGALPSVERLKILQGSSGLAVGISGAQGVGYVYGILVRLVQGRRVSPIEAVGFYLSTILLLRAMMHYFTSSCHRPLLVFLDEEMEKEFIDKCEGGVTLPSLTSIKFSLMKGGAYVLPCGVLVFFVIYNIKSISLTIAIPLIVLLAITFALMIYYTLMDLADEIMHKRYTFRIIFIFFILGGFSLLLHGIVYIYSLVLTWKYWKSLGYDIPTSGYLSKILPYIG